MQRFRSLPQLPPDPLLGLMAAFRSDQRPDKIDLGVGVFKDTAGNTPVMSSVAKAEAWLLDKQTTKTYEGARGNTQFCAAIEKLVFGVDAPEIAEGRTLSFATPGGCGALYIAAGILKRAGVRRVWVSNPTWPNHLNLLNSFNLEIVEYTYSNPVSGVLDYQGLFQSLAGTQEGDAILLQACCHNPTGIDLSNDQWAELGKQCRTNGVLPLIDVAYHGLADDPEKDINGVRAFLDEVGEALIAYSCSKNFGLYRERTGCILAIANSFDELNAISSQIAALARSSYSMPPAHGAAIVEKILSDESLRTEWLDELSGMRQRIMEFRICLAQEFARHSSLELFASIALQRGMFSQLPLNRGQVKHLIDHHAIYIPDSGRINLAGLRSQEVRPVVDALWHVMQNGNVAS